MQEDGASGKSVRARARAMQAVSGQSSHADVWVTHLLGNDLLLHKYKIVMLKVQLA